MSMDITLAQPINPIASLSSLPIEIKALIVQYSFLQDESYESRVDSTDRAVSELTENILKENKWRGHSLNALFLTDNCFSNLCAVYLFKILDKRAAGSTRFKHLVGPRRSPLFRKIRLQCLDVNVLKDLLSLAHTHSGMEEMEINEECLVLLLGDLANFGKSKDDEIDAMYHSFKRLALTIKHLSLNEFSCKASLRALRTFFPNLQWLSIDFKVIIGGSPEDTEDERALGLYLLNSSLVHLDFNSSLDNLPVTWLSLDSSLSTLSSLSVKVVEFTSQYLDLISKFSATLTTLNIEIHGIELPLESTTRAAFSMVKILRLAGTRDELKVLLELFKTSPLVCLEMKSNLTTFPETEETVNNMLVDSTSTYPSLRHLIFEDRFSRQELFTSLIDACAKKKISLEFPAWSNQLIKDDAFKYDLKDPQEDLVHETGIQLALKYGERRLSMLKKEKDSGELKRMYQRCKWLRASAAEMMD